jgi:formiminotetrahydrofolate cyclodeaminase
MRGYITTEEEVKNRQGLLQAARKYVFMNSLELSQALIALGTVIALRGHKEAGDDIEATAIFLNIKQALVTELTVGGASIKAGEEFPVKIYRLKKKLEVPDGDYALISVATLTKEENPAPDLPLD